MRNIYTFRASYKKSLAVVESCTNILQLESAKKYVNNFFKFHTTPSYHLLLNNVVEADDVVVKMYNKLFEKIKEKENFFKNS